MIYSFDIFDTVLTRRTLYPGDIHLLVARDLRAEGLWQGSLVEWRAAREAAERGARAAAGAAEIGLDDIAARLPSAGAAALAPRAIVLELQHELAEAVGIAATLAQLAQLVRAGHRICYTSDMYLPRAQILAMLERVGAPAAPLFLSCESGKTKRSGALFGVVAAHFGAAPGAITHTGDHVQSDHKVPAALGWRTVWLRDALPSMLEATLYQRLAGAAPLLAATLAGAMRAARLNLAPDAAGLLRLATQEGALVHIGFALWLLEQLGQLAPAAVSFLARDGYLSSQLYQRLRAQLAPALPAATYTYASRQSLHLPSLHAITPEDELWIMLPAQSLTFREWLFRLGLVRADLRALAPGAPLPPDEAPFAQCQPACLALLRSPDFAALALARAAQARALAADYLRPRLGPQLGKVAIVDIGWNGRMQRSIVQAIAPAPQASANIHGYYLGLLRTPPGSFGSYTAWLFDLRSEPRPYCASHFQLFETLFAAPHGTTYGYQRDAAGAAGPTLAGHDPMSAIWPDLIAFQQAIVGIAGAVRAAPGELAQAQGALRALCRGAVSTLFRAPSAEQARAFAGTGFSSDQANLSKEKLIYPLTWWQQYRCLLDRRYTLSANHWKEGQLALADAPLVRLAYLARSALRLLVKREAGPRDLLRRLKYHYRGA